MIIFLTVVCIILAIVIIAMVLLQQGKGSDLGSAFGGGSSNSMFGALGPSGFLGKLTYMLVAIWLILTMALAYIQKNVNVESPIGDDVVEEVKKEDASDKMPDQ